MPTYDTVIIGAGLAGVCTALHLSSRERVLLLEAGAKPAGASVVAAGLVNPFMARKARAVWRHPEALDALHELLAMANATEQFDPSGVYRPASDEDQEAFFRERASGHDECSFLDANASLERWPDVRAPHGGLFISGCGAVDLVRLLDCAIAEIVRTGGAYRPKCRVNAVEGPDPKVSVTLARGERIEANRIVLTAGAGLKKIAGVPYLDLHLIKGQTLDIDRSDSPYANKEIPHLAGSGYVVAGRSTLTLGSTYDHDFRNTAPDEAGSMEILGRVRAMLPLIDACDHRRASAGIRVTVPGTRLPMVGPLPGIPEIWVFAGLGSKGLLMAPLVAKHLPHYLAVPDAIPTELQVH